ncbi:MAG: hypothetical protein WKF44_05815 [Rubrobacteraceae bacterium]
MAASPRRCPAARGRADRRGGHGGAKTEILEIARSLADSGEGIIVISSELIELLAVSDRILILQDGQSGRYQWGEGDELSAIAAVILGGTSLFGGYGTVVGSVLGALLVGLINNGLTLMGLEFSQQQIVRGAIIILAVALARKGFR